MRTEPLVFNVNAVESVHFAGRGSADADARLDLEVNRCRGLDRRIDAGLDARESLAAGIANDLHHAFAGLHDAFGTDLDLRAGSSRQTDDRRKVLVEGRDDLGRFGVDLAVCRDAHVRRIALGRRGSAVGAALLAFDVDRRGLEVTGALGLFDLRAATTRARTRALRACFELTRTRARAVAGSGAGAFRFRVALAFAVARTRALRIFAVALAVALAAAGAFETGFAGARASRAARTRALRACFDGALAFAFGFALAADFTARAACFEFARFNRRTAFVHALRHAFDVRVALGRIELDGELCFGLRREHRLELRRNGVADLLRAFATTGFGLEIRFGHSEIFAERGARRHEVRLQRHDRLVHVVRHVEEGFDLGLNLRISLDVQRIELAGLELVAPLGQTFGVRESITETVRSGDFATAIDEHRRCDSENDDRHREEFPTIDAHLKQPPALDGASSIFALCISDAAMTNPSAWLSNPKLEREAIIDPPNAALFCTSGREL